MAKIYMVRHGEASAGFDGHVDPGLSDLGRQQAQACANDLQAVGPLTIYSSPLARAQETAAPLAALWSVTPIIETRVAEVPSPIDDLQERATWLQGIMRGSWTDLPADLKQWRQTMIDCVLETGQDSVFFSHFVAINILVGAATGVDAMVSFRPDNGSVTSFDTGNGQLVMIGRGAEAQTKVN